MVEPYNTNRPNKISNTDRVAYLLEREELMLPRDPFFQELLMFQQWITETAVRGGTRRLMALALACSVVATAPTADWLDMV